MDYIDKVQYNHGYGDSEERSSVVTRPDEMSLMAPGKGVPRRKSSEPIQFPRYVPKKLPSKKPAAPARREKTPA